MAHSEGRWAGALQLAPPGPLGMILVGHGGASRSDRYGTLEVAARPAPGLGPRAGRLETSHGRPDLPANPDVATR